MRTLAALFITAAAAFGADCPSGYGFFRSITVQSAQITGTLSNFPMLVLNPSASLKTVGNGGNVENSSGYDIVFATAAGSLLPFEMVGHGGAAATYSATTGNGEWWVNVSSIANGTAIHLCYGNAAVSTYQGNDGNTWNSAYVAIIHHGTASTLAITDSTGINSPSNTNSVTTGTGQIDGGATFVSASSQNINLGTNAALNSSALTYMGWLKATSFASTPLLVNKTGIVGFSLMAVNSSGKIVIFLLAENGAPGVCGAGDVSYNGTGSHTLSTGTFYHLAMTYDSSAGLVGYVDGASDNTAAPKGALCTNSGSTLEGDSLDGIIDELQISNVARSAAWVAAQYNNQSAPGSFYAVGSETPAGGALFTISPILLPANNAADIVVSLTGSGTSWDGTTVITATGVSGTSCGAVNVSSGTAATVTCTTGATTGTLTLTESVTGSSASTVPVGGAGGTHAFVGG